MELIALGVCFLVFILAPLYLAMLVYQPRWVDLWEFALITALIPLELSFEILYLSIAVAVVVCVVNIVVYRRDSKKGLPLGKDLLRMFIVPAMFLNFWGIYGIAAYLCGL